MERFIRESGLRIVEMAFDTYENTAKHQELVDMVIKSVEALL